MKKFHSGKFEELVILTSYLKTGWRNLVREQGYSFINIGGLALGIALTILIGLWVKDEMSFDKQQDNYHDVAAVLQNNTVDGVIETWGSQSYQLGPELRNKYGNYFKYVVMCSFPASSILQHNEKAFNDQWGRKDSFGLCGRISSSSLPLRRRNIRQHIPGG